MNRHQTFAIPTAIPLDAAMRADTITERILHRPEYKDHKNVQVTWGWPDTFQVYLTWGDYKRNRIHATFTGKEILI